MSFKFKIGDIITRTTKKIDSSRMSFYLPTEGVIVKITSTDYEVYWPQIYVSDYINKSVIDEYWKLKQSVFEIWLEALETC